MYTVLWGEVYESGSKWYVNQNRESTVSVSSKARIKPQDRKAHFEIFAFCDSDTTSVVSIPKCVLIGTEWLCRQRERGVIGGQGTQVPLDLRPVSFLCVVLCPWSSPLSSCNRKSHVFSCLCPLPRRQMSISGLKLVMFISFILLSNISCTLTGGFFCFIWLLWCDSVSHTQLFWGLFTCMYSVAKPSTASLTRDGSFSSLFPAWLLEESGLLWPCLGVQPWPSLIYWSSQSLFAFISYSFDFIYLRWWQKEENETSSVTALCQESKLTLLLSIGEGIHHWWGIQHWWSNCSFEFVLSPNSFSERLKVLVKSSGVQYWYFLKRFAFKPSNNSAGRFCRWVVEHRR